MDSNDGASGQAAGRGGRLVGRPMPRFEDLRLVRGAGRYTDDVGLPEQAFAVFVRAPHAHARIVAIDPSPACGRPGVLAVLTGEDYVADGHIGMAHFPNPADAVDIRRQSFAPTADRKILDELQLPLAVGRVRFVGEAVAVVVAETPSAARDAAEAVEVEYEALPSVTDALAALAPGAPAISPAAPDNLALDNEFGDGAAVEAAIKRAHLVVEQTIRNQRTASAFLEPRSAIGSYDAAESRYTLISGCQGVHRLRHPLAGCLKVPQEHVRVVCPDVGGAFGSRTNLYPEQVAVVWAARRVGRPVRWTADRSEAFLTDYTARDVVTKARLAFDRKGRMLALALELTGNIGAHTVSYVPLSNGYRVAPTVYDVPIAWVRLRGVMTNTVPTAPFRGAGRPEATTVMERLIDIAAKRLKIDRVELRRRNLIRHDKLPHRTATGLTYDSGDFAGNLARALATADWDGFPARRKEARARGKLRGFGISNTIERAGAPSFEGAEIRFDRSGTATLFCGAINQGQGHETVFKQIMCDRLGLDPADIQYLQGDTDQVFFGEGTGGSRSATLGGSAVDAASRKVIEKARAIAAFVLKAEAAQVNFADGVFSTPATNETLTLKEVARLAANPAKLPPGMEPGLVVTAVYRGEVENFPNGAHVCELEIDRDTGAVEIVRYSVVDDVGTVLNPLLLHGQITGGIAQGAGQILREDIRFDPDTGELLTGSFMDYAMPRASDLCAVAIKSNPVPTKTNPLGVKGAGEAGTVGAMPAVANALVDALSEFGVRHIEMPATAEVIWRAMGGGKGSA